MGACVLAMRSSKGRDGDLLRGKWTGRVFFLKAPFVSQQESDSVRWFESISLPPCLAVIVGSSSRPFVWYTNMD